MNNVIKKINFLCIVLLAYYPLSTAELLKQNSSEKKHVAYREVPSLKRGMLMHGYCRVVPIEVIMLIKFFVYDNPARYRNQELPSDLSEQDLSGFDFTGCQFSDTNLTHSNLTGVILSNTSCDYAETFLNNIKKSGFNHNNEWYIVRFFEDLTSIAEVYPELKNNKDKAQLLQIASRFSRLPFCKDREIYNEAKCCSKMLLDLRNSLPKSYASQLICSLENDLVDDTEYYSDLAGSV